MRLIRSGQNTICFKTSANLEQACTFQVLAVDAFDHFSFDRFNDEMTVLVLGIPKESIVVDLTSPFW